MRAAEEQETVSQHATATLHMDGCVSGSCPSPHQRWWVGCGWVAVPCSSCSTSLPFSALTLARVRERDSSLFLCNQGRRYPHLMLCFPLPTPLSPLPHPLPTSLSPPLYPPSPPPCIPSSPSLPPPCIPLTPSLPPSHPLPTSPSL